MDMMITVRLVTSASSRLALPSPPLTGWKGGRLLPDPKPEGTREMYKHCEKRALQVIKKAISFCVVFGECI